MSDVNKLFEQVSSEILDEDTKLQMAVLFETQLTEAIKAKEVQLQEDNAAEIKEFKEGITVRLDEYLEFFAEEFVKQNKTAITESVKIKSAEKVLKTFDTVMKDFHYQLDEKKISNDDKLQESRKEINKLSRELIESKKKQKDFEKAAIVVEASTKLDTELQKTKLVEYAKSIELDELYEGKVNAYVSNVISEAKIEQNKDAPTKIIIEKEEQPIIESKSAVDGYLANL